MSTFLRDVQFGTRTLIRTPIITGAIVLVLALGIAANSAVFAVVDTLLLHPVSYPSPETLIFAWSRDAQGTPKGASPADFLDWRERAKTLSGLAAWMPTSFVLTGTDRPRQVGGARVTANFFRTLQVNPSLGRTFLPDEDGLQHSENAARSAVISYRLWQEDFGGDAHILGRSVQVDSVSYSIVGVAPRGFQFWWREHDIWIPVTLNREDREYRDLVVVGRLNAPLERAQAEMNVIARSLEQEYPKTDKSWEIEVDQLQEWFLSNTFRRRLMLLSGAVGLVLLIACTNLAGLLLSRSAARSREIAVRVSLGATPGRLIRQLMTESGLLSFAGGGLGLALAWGLIRLAPTLVPANAIPGGSIELNIGVLWFTLGISVLCCFLFGMAPALAAIKTDIQSGLKDSSRGSTAGPQRRGFQQGIVMIEVAFALILTIGAGLMFESLQELTRTNPGFDPSKVLTVRLFLPAAKYNPEQALQFYRAGIRHLSTLPGVRNVTVGTALPLLNTMEVRFDREDEPPREAGERANVPYAAVSSDYFRTMRIPLKRGRFFTEADDERAPLVAIISEALATRYFGDRDPIGQTILLERPVRFQNAEEPAKVQIVGIVGNVRLSELSPDPKPAIYVPHPQNPWSRAVWFAARTEVDPSVLSSAARNEFMAIDREQPIDQIGTMEQMMAEQSAQPRFQTGLMTAFAFIAVILAAVGIYGVNAYSVTQRRNEIGVRMALGASRGDVMRSVMTKGMFPTAIGLAVGLGGAVLLTYVLSTVLVGMERPNPFAFVGATILLAFVAALACYIPAIKATRIDPAIALRTE